MSEDKPGAGVAGFSPSEPEHIATGNLKRWESGIPGLTRRHVKRIHIEWADKPPSDIAEARLRDIMQALRCGFKQTDRVLDAHEARLRESLAGSQED